LGFGVQGLCPCTPLKVLLKKFLKNPQNFQKGLFINIFLKVLEKGSGEKLLSRSFSPAFSSPPYKLQFLHYAIA